MTQVNKPMPNPKGNIQTLQSYQPKWKSGATKTIRVPIVLENLILEYARKLDESPSQVNHEPSSSSSSFNEESLSQAIQALNEALSLKANAGGAIKTKIREAIALLQGNQT
jgi:hypothetical protein